MGLGIRHWDRLGNGGLDFTELGFGAAPLGNLFRAISDTEANDILEAAWAGGVRYYDTAPLYGLGLSETRLNRFLRDKPRDEYVLSTKIGRLLKVCPPQEREGHGKWFDVPNRREVFDYTHDGIMRSIEFSLERLGIDRIDILFAHDIDVFSRGSQEVVDATINELITSGLKALTRLRDEGTIKAFGAGVNEWQPCQTMAERGDFDIFLLAGRYTLLEQEALDSFLPLCEERGIGIVLGGPYNSGILATGAVPGATWNYDPAPPHIMDRVAGIEAVCREHNTPLVSAAFQFPLQHPAVVSVIPGGQSVAQMRSNLEVSGQKIDPRLWQDLKARNLMRQDAPVSQAG